MKTMMKIALGLFAATLLALPLLAEETKVAIDKLPKAVVDAVKAKFPKAELTGAEKEIEDGKTLYEVAITSEGSKIEVTLTEDGKIVEIEKVITAKDLPKAVADALEAKYPKATLGIIEEITKGETIGYEVHLVTADKKELEVVFDPTGKVTKEEKKEEKKEKDQKEDK